MCAGARARVCVCVTPLFKIKPKLLQRFDDPTDISETMSCGLPCLPGRRVRTLIHGLVATRTLIPRPALLAFGRRGLRLSCPPRLRHCRSRSSGRKLMGNQPTQATSTGQKQQNQTAIRHL